MGFVKLTDDDKKGNRVLIVGAPNTFKTTSIVETFPKDIHLVSYPGEKGYQTIPTDREGIHAYIWKEDVILDDKGNARPISLTKQIEELENTTWKILAGAFGPIETFAGDGLHKLASLYWNREYKRLAQQFSPEQLLEVGKKGKTNDEEIKLQAYGNENYGACRDILYYLARVCYSNVPTVVFTAWEGPEPDSTDPGNRSNHIFADLPGKLARRTVGEFGVVLYAETTLPDPQGNQRGTWQIRKAGKVWGVGAKVPLEIAKKMPEKVPQDWRLLAPALRGETEFPRLGSVPNLTSAPKPASVQVTK